ncbi:4-carboxymuconolactone decarboxylase [Lacisediminihabitans profunda]|uniref:4-carboxymuconolactone decarboxylase n=1 Tax=Lacisediminihabitans profunda TaxID=2594790 RepID=A0A5C8UKJ5_9MICO|nr:4-carboxymuconolactone decarboxylase [Lacisediminihabitans profunda]TXN28337.1 4-carboxymuconolactone decarboxylase [Lacisediminihabitans profunda]
MTVPTLRCSIDPAGAESTSSTLLVLGPSLGTTTALWGPALAALRATPAGRAVRVLRFDLPGHGASPVASAPFDFAELADAVIRLVDETGGGRFVYAGVSFGGAIGIELALRHPHRLLGLAILNSDSKIGTAEGWADRARQVRRQGTPSLVGATPGRWFAPGFVERAPAEASRTLVELGEVDDESYALCCEALAGFDRGAEVGGIRVPTVVVGGESDPVTTAADLQNLAARIPGAHSVTIAAASHLAVLEQPVLVAEVLADLLRESADTAYERGMRVRREVLGDTHVDGANAKITPETADFQEFLTRYAWGDVWSRPGLGRRERSIATLASLVTGGHDNEIAMHVRAAIANGLTRAEIAEVLMHTALYAGLPAANGAFAIARSVFADLDSGDN